MTNLVRGMLWLVTLALTSRSSVAKKSNRWKYPIPQWPVPDPRKTPEPCRHFIWNVDSAVKFCECTRLLETAASTSLWQDSRDQLWLRLPSHSPLLRLFPCQRHSLTRCARCGHELRAHMRAAAEGRRSRAFEQSLGATAVIGSSEIPPQFRRSFEPSKGVGGAGAGVGVGVGVGEGRAGAGSGGRVGVEVEARDAARGGSVRWAKWLAFIAEAHRTSVIQLSGIGVTSASLQASFDEVRRKVAERTAAEKAKASRGEGGARSRRSGGRRGDADGAANPGSGKRGRRAGGRSRGRRRMRADGRSSSEHHSLLDELEGLMHSYKRVVYP